MRRPPLSTLAVVTAITAGLAGCGDDDASAGTSALCDAVAELDAIDTPGGPAEPTAEDLASFAGDIGPVVGRIGDALGERDADQLSVLDGAVAALSTGDASPLEDPAVEDSLRAIRSTAAADCAMPTVEVAASDFEFDLPDRLDAGRTLVEMSNEGAEPHVFLLVRSGDETETDGDLAELVGAYLASFEGGERPAGLEDVTGGGPFTLPGATNSHVFDLAPGRYVWFCPIPSGEDFSGPPHFALGMTGVLEVVE